MEHFVSTKGRLVRAISPDGVELRGFLSEPDRAGGILFLHLHGMFNNFYLPLYLTPLFDALAENKFRLLTANTRANDFLMYLRRYSTNAEFEWIRAGGSYETFSDCLLDIDAWLALCESLSVRVVLMGHSHGALKVAYYAFKRVLPQHVVGQILLSPSDDISMQRQRLGERFDEALALASSIIGRNGEEMMPDWAYGYPVSAKMYLDMFGETSELGLFRFDDASSMLNAPARFSVPTLVVFGERDKSTSSLSSQAAIERIQRSLAQSVDVTGQVVRGADHYYHGAETELARVVGSWASSRFLPPLEDRNG